jgi:hypothetical protein
MEYGEERIEECVEGASAMAERELGGGVELGHGLVVLRKIEEGIVAEAVGSARGGEDMAFYGAVAGAEDLAVAGGGEDAVVAGLTVSLWCVVECFEEAEIVSLVQSCGEWAGEVLVFGVTGGADSGCALQCVDFEAGVVGYYDVTGGMLRVVDGLQSSVAREGGLVFYGRLDLLQLWQGLHRDAARGCSGEVAELAGVGCGDVDHHASIDIPCAGWKLLFVIP